MESSHASELWTASQRLICLPPSGASLISTLLPEPPDPRSPRGERPPFQGGNVPNEDFIIS